MRQQIEHEPCTAADVLRGDEARLAEGQLAVRVGLFSNAAVSVGVSQRDVGELEGRAEREGLEVVRRSSGGTSLLHLPGDVFWSVVLPRDHPMAGAGFVHHYAGLGSGWVEFLRRRRVEARWERPSVRAEEYCLLASRGQALLVGARSLGGASQHVTRQALLHHGVVPKTLRPDLLDRLFGLSPLVVAQGLTSLGSERVSLEENDLSELASTLARGLSEPS